MRVAIFGGSFDPPHNGHYSIVKEALKQLHIDKLFVVPTFLNPWKDSFLAPPHQRFEWIKTLFKDEPRVEVSDFEIQNGRPTFAFETVRALGLDSEKVYFIIGADNVEKLHLWDNFDEIENRVTFAVATRDSLDIPDKFIQLKVEHPVSSTELRKEIDPLKIPKEIRESVTNFYKEKR